MYISSSLILHNLLSVVLLFLGLPVRVFLPLRLCGLFVFLHPLRQEHIDLALQLRDQAFELGQVGTLDLNFFLRRRRGGWERDRVRKSVRCGWMRGSVQRMQRDRRVGRRARSRRHSEDGGRGYLESGSMMPISHCSLALLLAEMRRERKWSGRGLGAVGRFHRLAGRRRPFQPGPSG